MFDLDGVMVDDNKVHPTFAPSLDYISSVPSTQLLNFFFRSAMVGDKEVGGGDLPTIADDLVVTKYKMAAEIVNSELVIIVIMFIIVIMVVYQYKMASEIVSSENLKYQSTNVATVPPNICHSVIS